MEWQWSNGTQWNRDACICRNWNYRWRTSYHWYAESFEYLPFKKVNERKLTDVTKKVNAVIRHTETNCVTQTKQLPMAAALWVTKDVGVKERKRGEKKEPRWKWKIESDITNLRRDINRLERE